MTDYCTPWNLPPKNQVQSETDQGQSSPQYVFFLLTAFPYLPLNVYHALGIGTSRSFAILASAGTSLSYKASAAWASVAASKYC